jgi:hypothetical protein
MVKKNPVTLELRDSNICNIFKNNLNGFLGMGIFFTIVPT